MKLAKEQVQVFRARQSPYTGPSSYPSHHAVALVLPVPLARRGKRQAHRRHSLGQRKFLR